MVCPNSQFTMTYLVFFVYAWHISCGLWCQYLSGIDLLSWAPELIANPQPWRSQKIHGLLWSRIITLEAWNIPPISFDVPYLGFCNLDKALKHQVTFNPRYNPRNGWKLWKTSGPNFPIFPFQVTFHLRMELRTYTGGWEAVGWNRHILLQGWSFWAPKLQETYLLRTIWLFHTNYV